MEIDKIQSLSYFKAEKRKLCNLVYRKGSSKWGDEEIIVIFEWWTFSHCHISEWIILNLPPVFWVLTKISVTWHCEGLLLCKGFYPGKINFVTTSQEGNYYDIRRESEFWLNNSKAKSSLEKWHTGKLRRSWEQFKNSFVGCLSPMTELLQSSQVKK